MFSFADRIECFCFYYFKSDLTEPNSAYFYNKSFEISYPYLATILKDKSIGILMKENTRTAHDE